MIALTKGQKPDVLVQHAAAWTAELLAAIAAGQELSAARRNRYNNAEVKDALRVETRKKCAYCESDFAHVAHGHIEHISPKAPNPQLTYEWDNLTLACDVCNTNKGVKAGIFDPYAQEPSQHFQFVGPMILGLPDSGVARASVISLDLNRTDLMEKRGETIGELEFRLVEILSTPAGPIRDLLIQALLDFARDPKTEYSACVGAHIERRRAEGYLS